MRLLQLNNQILTFSDQKMEKMQQILKTNSSGSFRLTLLPTSEPMQTLVTTGGGQYNDNYS